MENPERVTYFAATDSRGQRKPFGIKAKDRSRHMYVIGKTGMGKSTLLENMAIQDIQNGEGLAFIDPHGGTADKLLDYIPQYRVNDVIYFAPFDLDQPIAFNVMEDVGYDKRHLVVSGLMATFKKIWEDQWSARMEYILSNTLLALLEYPDATMLGVNRMYTDKAYRKKVVDNVKDPIVKDFWVKEFNMYTDRYTQEATPAIQNKIGQFVSNPLIRNIIGQPKSSFDIRDLMDRKKILIINLSKGQVGETNMRLLGSMLTTRIFLGAMSRADLSSHDIGKLPPFYFYVDEFQNFANDTFAEILSEARKYKLNLTIAHQYIEQMEEQVRAAVFGNVGTTVAFRVGPFDAETLETIFMPEFTKEDLVNLAFAQVYLTLMIDGVGSRPFSAVTIPPIEAPRVTYRREVIEASRKNFGTARTAIEQKIMEELSISDAVEMPETTRGERKASTVKRAGGERIDGDRAGRSPRPRTEYKRDDRESEVNRQEGQGGDRPIREAPPQKSAEDLRSILRAMTASSPNPRQNTVSKEPVRKKGERNAPERAREGTPPASLKDALRGALKDHTPKVRPAPELHDALEKVTREPDQRQSHPPQQGPQGRPERNNPFEVPEDTLRAIFKEQ